MNIKIREKFIYLGYAGILIMWIALFFPYRIIRFVSSLKISSVENGFEYFSFLDIGIMVILTISVVLRSRVGAFIFSIYFILYTIIRVFNKNLFACWCGTLEEFQYGSIIIFIGAIMCLLYSIFYKNPKIIKENIQK